MYGPPVDRDRPDLLGADDEHDDDDRYDQDGSESVGRTVVRAVTAPEALGLAALVLAVVSLLGMGLLNGIAYLSLSFDQGQPERPSLVAVALLGAALALLPVGLGVWALRRLPDESPYRTIAGAAVVVAGVSVLLRLVIAVRTGAEQDSLPSSSSDAAVTDWAAWHAPYDDPGSPLSQRLGVVRAQVALALDRAPAGPVRLLSLCAGQAVGRRRQVLGRARAVRGWPQALHVHHAPAG